MTRICIEFYKSNLPKCRPEIQSLLKFVRYSTHVCTFLQNSELIEYWLETTLFQSFQLIFSADKILFDTTYIWRIVPNEFRIFKLNLSVGIIHDAVDAPLGKSIREVHYVSSSISFINVNFISKQGTQFLSRFYVLV